MSGSFFDTPVEFLKTVGPQRSELLKKEASIYTFGDLLTYFPFRYVDRTRFYKVNEISAELPYIQLRGKITGIRLLGEKRGKRLVATFRDETGSVELVWFQGIKWMVDKLKPLTDYVIFGKPTVFNGKFNLAHPEIEEVSEENTKKASALQPVYPVTEKLKQKGFDSKGILRLQKILAEQIPGKIPEILPQWVLSKISLPAREFAFQNIHFPENPDALKKATLRIKFEELFLLQTKLLRLKLVRKEKVKGIEFSVVGNYFNEFYSNKLPFPLTGAQKRVLKEIRHDCGSGSQMNRLLQGDVGSGKTVVALMTMLLARDNGYQSALMAPTEILASQHFQTLSDLLGDMKVKLALLTGSTKTKERRILLERLALGEIDILVGTHALIEDPVVFKNLGLTIIDEQHRFGVEQRAKLWRKAGFMPHVLVMTATPIPRTLAMTLYGDLDVSVIDELPPGRKPVKTIHLYDSERLRVFGFMNEQIALGRQIYVVYPLIRESEKMDYKDLHDGYESIVRAFPAPDYQVSIVHGQMKPQDKDLEMGRFVKNETQIMVATTVIEVGVNVPNASVMIIESAERFGLSQLHQLRGRVGRGADQSYCILMTSYKLSADSKLRMETMVRTNDGFEISEVDLKLRGPGDIEGTRQSGVLDLKLSDLARDAQILSWARETAIDLLEKDPGLKSPENYSLAQHLAAMDAKKENWSRVS